MGLNLQAVGPVAARQADPSVRCCRQVALSLDDTAAPIMQFTLDGPRRTGWRPPSHEIYAAVERWHCVDNVKVAVRQLPPQSVDQVRFATEVTVQTDCP